MSRTPYPPPLDLACSHLHELLRAHGVVRAKP
jgi:hypothetical protein